VRIATLVSGFPAVSETFILRQITGLIDLGHEVEVYAEHRPALRDPVHEDVASYRLLERTTYLDADMPEDVGEWEAPVWPITGETWLPGAAQPIRNAHRVLRALPIFGKCLLNAPRVTLSTLKFREYGYQARSLSALYRLHAMLSRRVQYDVVHAHFGPTGRALRFAGAIWHAPLLVSFHGYDYSSIPLTEGMNSYLSLFREAGAVTVNSDYARVRLEELGCPTRKIRELRYGVDMAQFDFRERHRVPGELIRILTVGRLVEKKGIEYSIRAVAALRHRHPELRYDIVGEGPLRSALSELVRDVAIEDIVTFHGALDGNDVRELMSNAHLFVLSSVTAANGDQEGTPVSLIEAQASGLPVLSTLHSGIPEIVLDGTAGILVPERDVSALANGLSRLIERADEWPVMGRRGREHVVARHELRRQNEALMAIYEELSTR
jgi:colanic acid/amylovoran biosynthesis glycosyltransferase